MQKLLSQWMGYKFAKIFIYTLYLYSKYWVLFATEKVEGKLLVFLISMEDK